jgi:uncharacterized repeat protein (TIGR01451 family)
LKEGVAYNRKTGEITWKIIVNKNKVILSNAVVTDRIPEGQQYVPGSATIDNGADPAGFGYVDSSEEGITGILTYTFDDEIDDTYVITFKTQVTDPDVYAGNVDKPYENTAVLEADEIDDAQSTGSQQVISNVINKSGDGYDYKERVITWKVVVNANEMLLTGVRFTDDISSDMEYVADSFAVADAAGTPLEGGTFDYEAAGSADPIKTGTLTYTFPGTIDKAYTITFKTKLTDEYVAGLFETNGDKHVPNTASLTHSLLDGGVNSTGRQTIKNTVISKSGNYVRGNTFIDWTIILNANEIPLEEAVLTDELQAGLALDTASVRLFRLNINNEGEYRDGAGNLTLGDEVELASEHVQYDMDTRKLTFTVPVPAEGAYALLFRTDITDKSKSPFHNRADFNGTGTTQQGGTQPIEVAWSGSGSSGQGETGSITIYKVDADNTAKRLEGAEFNLIDRYGNVIRRGTTGPDGSLRFGLLKLGIPYSIAETQPPEGYHLNEEGYTFTLPTDGPSTVKNITYSYTNEGIYGNIRFIKTDENNKPVAGATFGLYDQWGNLIATAVSGPDGEVLFERVPYGDYTILEIEPAEGYLPTDTELTASITEDGETVTATPGSIPNQGIVGNVRLQKVDEDGETPLEGAVFALYRQTDTDFSEPVATAAADEEGIVYFEGVPYGRYIIKETQAPQGYALSGETVVVHVAEDGETYDLGVFANAWIRGGVEILKADIFQKPLAGAKFALYDALGELVAEAESGVDGIARFTDLIYGQYTIKEIEAPHMYVASGEEIQAHIDTQDMVLRFTVVNERDPLYPWEDDNDDNDDNPGTGDSISPVIAGIIAGASLLMMVLIGLPGRRVKGNGRKDA